MSREHKKRTRNIEENSTDDERPSKKVRVEALQRDLAEMNDKLDRALELLATKKINESLNDTVGKLTVS